MKDLPLLKPFRGTGQVPLPLGAQLIYAQCRSMERAGAVASRTTVTWELAGALDEAAMIRAMERLVRSRDFLRLQMRDRAGTGTIRMAEPSGLMVEALDGSDLENELAKWSNSAIPQGSPSGMLRIFRLERATYCIGLCGGHELLDAWTIHNLMFTLADLYNMILDGKDDLLPDPPGYLDFAAWHEDICKAGLLDASRDYWQDLLKGSSPVFDAPQDPDTDRHPMAMIQSVLPVDVKVRNNFEAKIRSAGCTIFEGYFTLFNLVLAGITGKQDLLTAFVASLRRIPQAREVEGCLLNRFYIPVHLGPDTDFFSLARQVNLTMKQTKPHCLWPVWQDRDPGGNGYPGVFFHYVPPAEKVVPEFKSLTFSPFRPVIPDFCPLPLAFQVNGDRERPMLIGMAQAGFCGEDWLLDVQEQYVRMMAEV